MAIAVALTLACGAAERSLSRATELQVVVQAPPEWTLGAAVRTPDENVAGNWTRPGSDLPDAESDAIVETIRPGIGAHELIVAWITEDAAPERLAVPLPLRGTEEIVLADLRRFRRDLELEVQLITRASDVEVRVIDPFELRFEIINRSRAVISGHGFPSGIFDGDLVALRPAPARYPRAYGYCGTPAPLSLPPLTPGTRTESGPSPWGMGIRPHVVAGGDYLWIVQLHAVGWGELVRDERIDGIAVRVARVQAAIARFSVPLDE